MLIISVAMIVCCVVILLFALVAWLLGRDVNLIGLLCIALFLTPIITAFIIHHTP